MLQMIDGVAGTSNKMDSGNFISKERILKWNWITSAAEVAARMALVQRLEGFNQRLGRVFFCDGGIRSSHVRLNPSRTERSHQDVLVQDIQRKRLGKRVQSRLEYFNKEKGKGRNPLYSFYRLKLRNCRIPRYCRRLNPYPRRY